MHEPLDRVRLIHTSHPGAETCVGQPVAEATDDVAHHQRRVRWVKCEDEEGDEVTEGRHDRDAALAEAEMDAGIGEGGGGVANEGGKEDKGDDGVGNVVILLKL